jgi:teichuronic acid biosynthesis glycosyltransferase TuaC
MGRLRIAVVTPELPNREYPNRGSSIYQTLRHLSNQAEVQALCPLPRYPARFLPRFDYRQCDLSYSLPDVPVHYFEYPAFPVVSRPVNGYTCAHYLKRHLRAFGADVILNFWLYPAGFAALNIGRKLGVPVVVGSIGSDLNGIPDPVSRWLTRKTLSGAARVIAKSEQLRLQIIAMGIDREKTHVVTNGCDETLFFKQDRASARRELKVPAAAQLIAFVGRMHSGKGVHELLDSAASLAKKRPNVRLVYVGDGPELKVIREKVCQKNLTQLVDFAGACSSAEVAKWFAAANLVALPSHAEGCPNVVIESLSCGRPVVASEVGGVPELVDRSCGILVPISDLAALTGAIDAALSTVWDEDAIAKRFRRSWRQVADEVLAICEISLCDAQAQRAWN